MAKSYLLLNVLRHAEERGFRWRLLPLEDDAGRWIQRMLAVHLCDWSMVAQPEDDSADTRRQVAERKLAHNVITLTRSDPPVESEVFSRFIPTVEHRLTLSVLKSWGGMSGDRIAMDLHEYGPQFIEHGKIKAKTKGRK